MEDIFDSAWCSQQKFAGIYRNALLSLNRDQLEIWIVAYWIESYIIYSVSMGSFFHPPFIWLYLHFLNYWFGLYMKKEKYIVFCSVKSVIFSSLSLSYLTFDDLHFISIETIVCIHTIRLTEMKKWNATNSWTFWMNSKFTSTL